MSVGKLSSFLALNPMMSSPLPSFLVHDWATNGSGFKMRHLWTTGTMGALWPPKRTTSLHTRPDWNYGNGCLSRQSVYQRLKSLSCVTPGLQWSQWKLVWGICMQAKKMGIKLFWLYTEKPTRATDWYRTGEEVLVTQWTYNRILHRGQKSGESRLNVFLDCWFVYFGGKVEDRKSVV